MWSIKRSVSRSIWYGMSQPVAEPMTSRQRAAPRVMTIASTRRPRWRLAIVDPKMLRARRIDCALQVNSGGARRSSCAVVGCVVGIVLRSSDGVIAISSIATGRLPLRLCGVGRGSAPTGRRVGDRTTIVGGSSPRRRIASRPRRTMRLYACTPGRVRQRLGVEVPVPTRTPPFCVIRWAAGPARTATRSQNARDSRRLAGPRRPHALARILDEGGQRLAGEQRMARDLRGSWAPLPPRST